MQYRPFSQARRGLPNYGLEASEAPRVNQPERMHGAIINKHAQANASISASTQQRRANGRA
jgi:hypothetical protein